MEQCLPNNYGANPVLGLNTDLIYGRARIVVKDETMQSKNFGPRKSHVCHIKQPRRQRINLISF